MLAPVVSKFFARHNAHYAWMILAVLFFSGLVMAGTVGMPGVFIDPISKEFQWNAAKIAGALAIRFALFGLMAPFSAALIERYGVRKVMMSAQFLVLIGFSSALYMGEFWQLALGWGVLTGVGTGLTALVLGAVVAGRWFSVRRGLATGILAAALATGQLAFLPLAAWIIQNYGWRMAVWPCVAAILAAMAATWLFMVERPADLGLRAYGATGDERAPPAAPATGAIAQTIGALAQAVRVPAFWMLAISFFICGLSTNGLIQTHFISFCVDNGMIALTAASALAMMGVFDIFGTIGSGYLTDRFDARKLLFWYYGLRGLSLLALPSSNFTFYGLSLFAVFYGLDWIATVPPTVRLTARFFSPQKAGVIFGWIFASHQLGAATAAWLGGLSKTWLLTYAPSFYLAGVACLVAAILSLAIGRGRTLTAASAAAA